MADGLSPCCYEWRFGAVHGTHTCSSRLRGGPPGTHSSHSHWIWRLTLKLLSKGTGLCIRQARRPCSPSCLWHPPCNHSGTQICIWLLRTSQPPVSGLQVILNATYSPDISIKSEGFLEESVYRICIHG